MIKKGCDVKISFTVSILDSTETNVSSFLQRKVFPTQLEDLIQDKRIRDSKIKIKRK
jgi:hypothetical protein